MTEKELKAMTDAELKKIIYAAASELFDREAAAVAELQEKAAAAADTESFGKLCAAAGTAAGTLKRRWAYHGEFYDAIADRATGLCYKHIS